MVRITHFLQKNASSTSFHRATTSANLFNVPNAHLLPPSQRKASTKTTPLSRSKYTSHVRKAFLLRVHPDRFRFHSSSIQKQQADIVQQVLTRMESSDFLAYTHPTTSTHTYQEHPSHISPSKIPQEYFLEQKDGKLIQNTFPFHDSVEQILQHMVTALSESGGAALPSPPPAPSLSSKSNSSISIPNLNPQTFSSSTPPQAKRYQHKGRNLLHFLTNILLQNPKDITERKMHRMDAHAAALTARRLFSFQSINGTRIHWSSHSMAKLFHNVIHFHDEYHSKFHVTSFYPIQLEFSNEERSGVTLCIYSGTMYLNPSSTPVQWLESFLQVTPDIIHQIKKRKEIHTKNMKYIQKYIPHIQMKQGLSCDAKEYHESLENLVQHLQTISSKHQSLLPSSSDLNDFVSLPESSSNSLSLPRIQMIVESCCSFRRPKITHEGHIRLGSQMLHDIFPILEKLHSKAFLQKQSYDTIQHQCQNMQTLLMSQYGFQKVYCVSPILMKSEEFLDGLERLWTLLDTYSGKDEMQDRELKEEEQDISKKNYNKVLSSFVGQSLGIAKNGHFCQLGDDGSLIIPSDFS